MRCVVVAIQYHRLVNIKTMVDRGEHVDITNLPMKVREEVGSPQYLTKEIFTNISQVSV